MESRFYEEHSILEHHGGGGHGIALTFIQGIVQRFCGEKNVPFWEKTGVMKGFGISKENFGRKDLHRKGGGGFRGWVW